jgi:hypothetical protein
MANPNVGQQVAAAWQAVVGTKPEDNIFEEYSLLALMEKGKASKAITGGRSAIGSIEYAVNSTVKAISDTETLDVTRVDVFDEAEYQWKQYAGDFVVSSYEEAITRGSNQKIDLLEGKAENLRQSMRKRLNEDLFGDGTADSSKSIGGLQVLVPDAPTAGTRGGISAVSFSFWRSQQQTGTKTTNAYDNLRSSMRTINTACSRGQGVMNPTDFVTGPTTCQGYEALLIANERITSKADSDANAGFNDDAFMFKKAKVRWDDDCADSRMYALRFGKGGLYLPYQSGYWFKAYPAVNPANQLLDVVKVETIATAAAFNPRHLGVITVIT